MTPWAEKIKTNGIPLAPKCWQFATLLESEGQELAEGTLTKSCLKAYTNAAHDKHLSKGRDFGRLAGNELWS